METTPVDPRGRTVRPAYRRLCALWGALTLLTLVLLAAFALEDAAFALVLGGTFLMLLAVPAGVVLALVVYRGIEFREDGITLRRYLFPDLRYRYGEIGPVTGNGIRLSQNRRLTWRFMDDGDRVERAFRRLVENGVIEQDPESVREDVRKRARGGAATITGVALGSSLTQLEELAAAGLGPLPTLGVALAGSALLYLGLERILRRRLEPG